MADVTPFRGTLYSSEKIDNLADVVTPPFDVISPAEQEKAYAIHPNNMIRLELSRASETDTDEDNPHSRAAACWRRWVEDGILVRDRKSAFYLTATEFSLGDRRITRHGLIGRVRLEPFEKGVVLPHEKTFSRVRAERLNLMKAAHANFSPIFSLYPDPDNEIMAAVTRHLGDRTPDFDFADTNGQVHRLWRLLDDAVLSTVTERLITKQIYIADGHHRYETALAYLDWRLSENPDLPPEHPARYVMMHLTAMEDPGLVILPAHRLLKQVPGEAKDRLLHRAPEFFQIRSMPGARNGARGKRDAFAAGLSADSADHTIGIFMSERSEFFLLTLKPGVMGHLYGKEIPETLRRIDVTVLTRLILMELLGFDQARLDNDKLIGYASTLDKAVEEVAGGDYDIAFILNPTRIDQVKEIADGRLIMPRKATYFYPKVITGMVLNSLSD